MTTPDPAALRVALADYDVWASNDGSPWIDVAPLAKAARWALDLIEGGQLLLWCVNHDGPITQYSTGNGDPTCLKWTHPKSPCRFESQIRVGP